MLTASTVASIFSLGASSGAGSSALAAALNLPLDASGRLAPSSPRDTVTLELLVSGASALADAGVTAGSAASALNSVIALLDFCASHKPWAEFDAASEFWDTQLAALHTPGGDDGRARDSGEAEESVDGGARSVAASAADAWMRTYGLLAPRPFSMFAALWQTGESLSEPRLMTFRPIVESPLPREAILPLSSAQQVA